jgi:hypothetical protein
LIAASDLRCASPPERHSLAAREIKPPGVAAINAEVNWRATQDNTTNTYVIEIAI